MEKLPQKTPYKYTEHLKQGVLPIIACVGDYDDYGFWQKHKARGKFVEVPGRIHNVDYKGSVMNMRLKHFLNGGEGTYVLSTIDGLDKFSEQIYDCFGLIVSGSVSKDKQVSFVGHLDPKKFLIQKERFVQDLDQRLNEMKDMCLPGTVDAMIVGGKSAKTRHLTKEFMEKNYLDSIELISLEVKKVFNFNPIIENGPKHKVSSDQDDIYFENDTRHLYFFRQDRNTDIGSFTKDELEQEKEKWQN